MSVLGLLLACTTIIAGRNTTPTGFVLVGHNEDDGGVLFTRHGVVPARDWPEGAVLPAEQGRAAVPQARHTDRMYWSEVKSPAGGPSNADAFLNEHGVYVVSNGAMPVRDDPSETLTDGGVEYNLRRIVAERATSSRHGLQIATNLVVKYGYAPQGRMYTIADRNEAWVIQVAHGRRLAVRRVPDDEVAVIPNCFTIPGFAQVEQAPRRWRSPRDVYRWQYGLLKLCGGIWTDARFVFSERPQGLVTVDRLTQILTSHYEDLEEMIAIPEYDMKKAAKHEGDVVLICNSGTVESSVCAFGATAAETVLHVAHGRGCEKPYETFRPFAGEHPNWADWRDDASARLDAHVRPMTPGEAVEASVENGDIHSAVSAVVGRDGELTVASAGCAPDTVFALFSVSKSVCGVAAAILVDEGKLSLDDPVAKYLPEFADVRVEERIEGACGSRLVPPRRPVAVRDLLCHCSGCALYVPLAHRALSAREVARLVASTPLKAHPGETFRYNNPGIDTAGAVIEVVSGQKYEEFLERRIFRPLGMADTTFFPNADQVRRMARFSGADPFARQLEFPAEGKVFACPSAGLYSTASDFVRFTRMLAGRGAFGGVRILSEKTFMETIARKQTPDAIPTAYSLGNRIEGDWVGHSGTLKCDQRANIRTGEAKLFFTAVSVAGGAGFDHAKAAWEMAVEKGAGR